MIHAGASAEEAESRYSVPKRFQHCRMGSWSFTVGGAMQSYFSRARASKA
jgi:hypothetical protein